MAQREILSLAPIKKDLIARKEIYTPLEFYLNPVWQKIFIPENTVYITAAASSGGYRAYLERWGKNQEGTDHNAWKPNGDRQHTIIGMNASLITDMVEQVNVPEELQTKSFMIPHEIGLGVPAEFGTLMGKNEADLMMQWMMRIAGVSPQVATTYYEKMMNEHPNVRKVIGDATIPKPQKVPRYIELIQTFLDTMRSSTDPIDPVSAIILGLDWKNSLGSRLEAAFAHILEIPLYEMVMDKNHQHYQQFIQEHHLEKIKERIHLPSHEGDGSFLISAEPRDAIYIQGMLKDILAEIR